MTGDATAALRADREAVPDIGSRPTGADRAAVKACGDRLQLRLAAQLQVF